MTLRSERSRFAASSEVMAPLAWRASRAPNSRSVSCSENSPPYVEMQAPNRSGVAENSGSGPSPDTARREQLARTRRGDRCPPTCRRHGRRSPGSVAACWLAGSANASRARSSRAIREWLLVTPATIGLTIAPLADIDDERQVPHELVVDDEVAAAGLLVLPQQVGPGAVDARLEVLVPLVDSRTGASAPSRSALKTSNGVSGFPREFILM